MAAPDGKDCLDYADSIIAALGAAATIWVATLALRLQRRELQVSVRAIYLEKRIERLQSIADMAVGIETFRAAARTKSGTKAENSKSLRLFSSKQREVSDAIRSLSILHPETEVLIGLWKERIEREDVDSAATKGCEMAEAASRAKADSVSAEKCFLERIRKLADGSELA